MLRVDRQLEDMIEGVLLWEWMTDEGLWDLPQEQVQNYRNNHINNHKKRMQDPLKEERMTNMTRK